MKHVYGQDSIRFLSIHDDENTGAEAAMDFIRENGGSLVELQYGKERNINFNLKSSIEQCIFDTNGMFTDTGAYRNIKNHTRFHSDEVLAIRSLGENVTEKYHNGSMRNKHKL